MAHRLAPRLLAAFLLGTSCVVAAQTAPPPRTIADILTALEQHRGDPARADNLRAALEAPAPPETATREARANHLRQRAVAASQFGDAASAVRDFRSALELVQGSDSLLEISLEFALSSELVTYGSYAESMQILLRRRARNPDAPQDFGVQQNLIDRFARLGDVAEMKAAFGRLEQAYRGVQQHSSPWVRAERPGYEGRLENMRAVLLRMENRFEESERTFQRAIAILQKDLESGIPARVNASFRPAHVSTQDVAAGGHGRLEGAEGNYFELLLDMERSQEAEVIARDLLSRRLARLGRWHRSTAQAIRSLGRALYQQGRYAETQKLIGLALEIFERNGVSRASIFMANTRRFEARALSAQGLWAEAVRAYERSRTDLASDPETARRWLAEDAHWALALARSGRAAESAQIAEVLLRRMLEVRGPDQIGTGIAHGMLAIAFHAGGERARAAVAYAAALRVFTLEGSGDGERAPANALLMRAILEDYVRLLIESGDAARAFEVADLARGQSVQRALAASAARAALNDPQLAQFARREQDLDQEVRGLYSYLGNMLSAPPEQRLPKVEADMRKRIDAIRAERKAILAEMKRRAPRYVELLNPRAPSMEETRRLLRPGEALVSVLVTAERTFVWALPQQGEPATAVVPLGAAEASRIVGRLRAALEPEETLLAKFPPFDVAAAHRLYAQLLQPVEAGWRGATTLLVVANGAFGSLPFAVLPTAPVPVTHGPLLFSGYREVPWLAKRVAIAQLPSVGSLQTLRTVPPPKEGRLPLAAFGDPVFGRSDLTPLPDTREELLAIAKTLGADAREVVLGAEATRRRVLAAPLANRRVVAFATHGLIPGDLPGLEQPALALAAATDPKESALLTLEDVLGLKLDADWVVLSACNTASGDGEGAEAVSGLGRGFFYAGTRALLVTHWPVESRSARLLVTALFERYGADPAISRAEALRQAMLAAMQEAGPGPDGRPHFSYAHPLYWAPYALIGDAAR
jgi:CHAT domain-containing protein/tetratricopeptide (TPR) repeat protein